MSDIKYPPIAEILKRRLQADTLPTLADQIVPVITLESMMPEYFYLSATPLCMGTIPTGQLEVTNSTNIMQAMLSNPSGSGTLVVLERAHGILQMDPISAGNSPGAPRVMNAAAGLGNLHLQASMRDFRWFVGSSRQGVAQIRSLTAAASSGTLMCRARSIMAATQGTTVAKSAWDWNSPIVISPGNALSFEAAGLAGAGIVTTFQASFIWREYRMSQWEASIVG